MSKLDKLYKLATSFEKFAQGFEYSGRAKYEEVWTKYNLWTMEQIGGTVQKLLMSARFSKTGSLNVDISVDDKLNIKYYVTGDLAEKDPQGAKRFEQLMMRAFATKHKQALVKENVTATPDKWNWISGIEIE